MEKDVAEHIKKEFDKKHGSTWHCIVGRNFGNNTSQSILHNLSFLGFFFFGVGFRFRFNGI